MRNENKDRKILVITPKKDSEFENLYRATKNIEGVTLITANMINTYEVLNSKMIFLMKPSIEIIKSNFLKEKTK